ncbi:MAG: HNH endonuclease, partial [Gammaproteobacteria bacterium]
RDGRIDQPDVQEAIQIKLAHIANGGYDEKERHIPSELRTKVIEFYGVKCNSCGQPGTDIGHINEPNNELDNLQLLCRNCHNNKTFGNVVTIKEGDEMFDDIKGLTSKLWERVESDTPMKICDDDENWRYKWRSIVAERRKALNQKIKPTNSNGHSLNS